MYYILQNVTRLFNIYGITEVSCWATCYEISLPSSNSTSNSNSNSKSVPSSNSTSNSDSVPIGECLMDTCIELRDQTVTSNQVQGTIWIGMAMIVILYDYY